MIIASLWRRRAYSSEQVLLIDSKGLLQPEHELPMADIITGFLHRQNPDVARIGNGTE
jgi:hypothetical protein